MHNTLLWEKTQLGDCTQGKRLARQEEPNSAAELSPEKMLNKRYNLYQDKANEERAVKLIQSVRHLKKHLGRLIVAEKILRVGIRKSAKRKEKYGKR